MNHRRRLLLALGVAASIPRAVFAQPKKAPVVIGWLSITSSDLYQRELTAFKEALAALGWKDGANVVIEARWAEGRPERLPLLIEVLVLKKAAVIMTMPAAATTSAVARHAPNIPVVQVSGGQVDKKLAASLARPGGMVTGLTNLSIDLIGKRAELLVDALPGIQRLGYLLDSNVGRRSREEQIASARTAAERLNRQFIIAEAGKSEDLDAAFAEFRKSAAQGLVFLPSSYLLAETRRIMQLALKHKLPAVVSRRDGAEAGALISYGHDSVYNATRAAWYVDQILKGVKPGDLPIEQPSKFELVVNLKTAKALGITVPQVVMVRADHVIQ